VHTSPKPPDTFDLEPALRSMAQVSPCISHKSCKILIVLSGISSFQALLLLQPTDRRAKDIHQKVRDTDRRSAKVLEPSSPFLFLPETRMMTHIKNTHGLQSPPTECNQCNQCENLPIELLLSNSTLATDRPQSCVVFSIVSSALWWRLH